MLHPTFKLKITRFPAAQLAIALLINVATQDAHALQRTLEAGVGVEYSNNIRAVDINQEDELTRIGMIGFSLEEDSEPITADIRTTLRYESFANETFDDQLLFNLASQAEWRIVPDRLSWMIRDDFRQLRVDSTNPSTPDNIQDSNVFSTGPDAFFRFGPVNRLELGARYIDTRFEVSTSNSKRYTTSAKWRYTPTSARELSLNIDAEKAEFEAVSSNSDFFRVDYFAAFLIRSGRSELEYEIGITTVKRANRENANGPLMGLYWTWSPTPLSTFNVSASSKITDSGRNLLTTTSDTDQDLLQTEQISSNLFRERRLGLAYTRDGDRVTGELSTHWIDQDYETAPLDREIIGALATINYNLTAPVVLSANARYNRTKVFATREQNDDLSFSAGLGYLLSRNLIAQMVAGYLIRSSNLPDQGYDEFRALLAVVYGFGATPGGSLASSR